MLGVALTGIISPLARLFDCLRSVELYRTNRIPILNSVSNVQTIYLLNK